MNTSSITTRPGPRPLGRPSAGGPLSQPPLASLHNLSKIKNCVYAREALRVSLATELPQAAGLFRACRVYDAETRFGSLRRMQPHREK